MTSFIVWKGSGQVSMLLVFPALLDRKIKIDSTLCDFLVSPDDSYIVEEPFACLVYRGDEGGKFSDLLGTQNVLLDVNKVCAILAHLTVYEKHLLDIPVGAEEINILIGYVAIAGKRLILYLEHEKEKGKNEEIHLHVCEDNEEEGPILVLKLA